MKKFGAVMVILLGIVIIILALVIKNKKVEYNSAPSARTDVILEEEDDEPEEEKIIVDEDKLKQEFEGEKEGIEFSNFRVEETTSEYVVISMNIKNNNEEAKNVEVEMYFYDENNEEIGGNSVNVELDPNEEEVVENTTFFLEKKVASAKVKVELYEAMKDTRNSEHLDEKINKSSKSSFGSSN